MHCSNDDFCEHRPLFQEVVIVLLPRFCFLFEKQINFKLFHLHKFKFSLWIASVVHRLVFLCCELWQGWHAEMVKQIIWIRFSISCHLRLIQGCSIRRLDWKFDNLASFTNSVFWLLSTRICRVAAGLAFVSLNHSRILCHGSCIVLGWTGIFQIDSFTNCVSWLLNRPVAAGLEILT